MMFVIWNIINPETHTHRSPSLLFSDLYMESKEDTVGEDFAKVRVCAALECRLAGGGCLSVLPKTSVRTVQEGICWGLLEHSPGKEEAILSAALLSSPLCPPPPHTPPWLSVVPSHWPPSQGSARCLCSDGLLIFFIVSHYSLPCNSQAGA